MTSQCSLHYVNHTRRCPPLSSPCSPSCSSLPHYQPLLLPFLDVLGDRHTFFDCSPHAHIHIYTHTQTCTQNAHARPHPITQLTLLSNALLITIPWMKISKSSMDGDFSKVNIVDALVVLLCKWKMEYHTGVS